MKVIQGIVTSAKTSQTVIVSVTHKWQHPVYKKYVKRTKNYACHVEGLEVVEGDVVTIKECRPMSKTKKFKVVDKIERAKPTKVAEVAEVKVKKEVKKKK